MARLPEKCKNHMTHSTEPHDASNYMRSPKWDGLDILDSASTDSQSNGSDISVEVYDETASSFDSFAIYMQTELPRLLEAELDSQISELNHLESSLKAKLVDVVRNCQTSLFQKWNSVEAPASRHDFPQINTSQIVGMRSCEYLYNQ
ncbi:hypothetical protein V8E54_003322 [Elaphomyces granulatus]